MAYEEWPLLASQMGLLLMDHATVGSHFFISQFDQFLSKATLILTTYLIGIYICLFNQTLSTKNTHFLSMH